MTERIDLAAWDGWLAQRVGYYAPVMMGDGHRSLCFHDVTEDARALLAEVRRLRATEPPELCAIERVYETWPIPALAAEVRRLEAENERLGAALASVRNALWWGDVDRARREARDAVEPRP